MRKRNWGGSHSINAEPRNEFERLKWLCQTGAAMAASASIGRRGALKELGLRPALLERLNRIVDKEVERHVLHTLDVVDFQNWTPRTEDTK